MKRKLLVILFSILAMVTAVFGLTACGDTSSSDNCEHNFTVVRQSKKATCTEAGSREVQKCDNCRIYYIPATLKEFESEDDAFNAAALGGGSHALEFVDKQEPESCGEPGYYEHYKCNNCKKLFDDGKGKTEITFDSIKIEGEHDLAYSPSVDPGCFTAGNYAHYKCDDCGKLFGDSNANQEITLESVTRAPAGHDFEYGHHERVEPTCLYGGSIEYYSCSRCQKWYTEETAENEITNYDDIWLSALEHDLSVATTLVEAGCEIDEVIRYSCSRTDCEYYEDETTEDSALGHSFVGGKCTNCQCDEFSLGLLIEEVYYFDDYTVTGLGSWQTEEVLVIPNTYKGEKVSAVNIENTSALNGVKKIILPENVKSVRFSDDIGNTTVTEVVIKSGEMSFGESAFYGFSALKTITVPDEFTVKSIGSSAFSGTAIEKFTFDGDYDYIGNGTFYECSNLTEIYIPSSVTEIRTSAFYECTSLEKVIINDVKDWLKIYMYSDAEANPLHYAHHFYKKTNNGVEPYGDIVLDENIIDAEFLSNYNDIGQNLFRDCYDIVKVSLPYGVVEIEDYAFKGCINLVEVELSPKSCIDEGTFARIFQEAFMGCTSLESITIPSSLTTVYYQAFKGCEEITRVYFAGYSDTWRNTWLNVYFSDYTSNPMYAGNATLYLYFDGDYRSTEQSVLNIKPQLVNDKRQPFEIKNYTFAGFNAKIDGIDYAYKIGNYAFYNAKGVKGYLELDGVVGMSNADYPNDFKGASQIGTHAFDGCVNLGEVRLSDNLASVGDYAFANSGITSLYMVGENTTVGSHLLENCNNVESLYLAFLGKTSSDNYNYKVSYYFGDSAIPTSLKYLDVASGNYRTNSLKGVTGLKALWLPSDFFVASDALGSSYSTTSLPSLTIYYAGTLENWISEGGLCDDSLSSSITLYVWDADSEQYDLVDKLVIPATITSGLGSYTFANVTSITTVTFHSNFRFSTSNDYTFYGCRNLLEIYNYTTTELTMGSKSYGYVARYAAAIYSQANEEIRVVTTEDGYVFGISKVEEGEVADLTLHAYRGNGGDLVLPSTVLIGGLEYNEYTIATSAFENNKTITSVVIPSNVKKIGGYAFSGCTNLKKVVLNEGLESIGDYAFASTAIYTFTIPNSVTEVRTPVSSCKNLYQITIGENSSALSSSFYTLDKIFEIIDYSSTNSELKSSSEIKSYGTTSNIYKQGDFVFGVVGGEIYLLAYEGDESVITLPSIDGTYAIYECFLYEDTTVTKVIIPSCVTDICTSAFSGSALSEVVISEGVKRIGYGAFSRINSLKEVVLPNSLEIIDYNAFDATTVEKLIFSDNSYPQISEASFSEIKEIYINSLSHLLALDTNCSLYVNGTSLYIDGSLITELVITGSDTSVISARTFTWLTIADKVTIDGVGIIEESAFANLKTNEIIIKNVNVIEDGAFAYNKAKKVTLENVSKVGEEAFYNSNVEEVILNGVEYLGLRSFAECYNLTNINLGNGLKMVDAGAFYNVPLDEVVLPETIEYVGSNAFYSAKKNLYKNSLYLGTETNPYKVLAIAGYESMVGIVIHEDCTVIGGGAFGQYTNVPITLHEGIVSIGNEAFENFTFTTITLPSTLKYIGERAFYNTDLTSITIPANVVYIGEEAFKDCNSLSSVIFEEGCGITEINEVTFGGCPLTSVVLPDSVQYVASNAFGNLQELTIGNNLVYVEEYAFGLVKKLNAPSLEAYLQIEFENFDAQFLYSYSDYGKIYVNGVELTEIVVPQTITEIHAYAFYGNQSITSLVGHDNLERIGAYAFYGAKNLPEIDLKGVKVVEEYAFGNAYALTTISMAGIEEIGDYAFQIYDYDIGGSSRLANITIGANLKSVGEYAFTYGEPEVNFLGTVDGWASIDFANISANPARYKGLKINGSKLADVTLTASEVKAYTFYNNRDITSLTFADSVKKIGDSAFYMSNNYYENDPALTSIIIGNGVTEIGHEAFYFQYKVSTLSIGNSVKVIGEEAFGYNSSLTSVILSDSVEELKKYAFTGCKFKTLHIGKSLNTVGENALCSGITSITVDSNNEYFVISDGDLYTKDLSERVYNV